MNGQDFFKGDSSILYIKFNDVFAPVACLTSHTISEQTKSVDTTVFIAGNPSWETSTPDFQSYNVEASGLMINDQSGPFTNRISLPKLKTLKRNRVIFEWEILTDQALFVEAGTAYITNLVETANVGEFIAFDITLKGQGELNSGGGTRNITWDRTDITFDQDDVTFDQT